MIISEWWQDPLSDDIYATLKHKEEEIPRYLAQSPQLHQRRYLVDWAAEICDQFSLCYTTRHLAIHLLDFFMDNFFIDLDRIFLVVLGCILVASKYEEKEVDIPRWPQLNNYIHNSTFTGLEFVQMEITLLTFFKWQVGIPTAAHFTDYFLMISLKAIMVHCESPNWVNQIQYFMAKYIDYFLEISLQDQTYRKYRPSLVAAASITASRICLNIPPSWPKEMEQASGYLWEEIEDPVCRMLESQKVDRNKDETQKSTPPPTKMPLKAPDSGYRST
ncbi:cyclin-J-like isoform X2 [Lineus longissimus]